MSKRIKIKLNFWRFIRNIGRIKLLIVDVVDLYERVKNLSNDLVVRVLINRIEKTLEEILGYEKEK